MSYFTNKNITFRIDTFYENGKYYCKCYCLKCNGILCGETNSYNTEESAKISAKSHAANHSLRHHPPSGPTQESSEQ